MVLYKAQLTIYQVTYWHFGSGILLSRQQFTKRFQLKLKYNLLESAWKLKELIPAGPSGFKNRNNACEVSGR
jgi:hypothetical protein